MTGWPTTVPQPLAISPGFRTTENVYRIRPDDVGLAIKVQVDFTDDAGNIEVLSSATTVTVVASEPGPPEHFTALPGDPGDLDLEWEAPSFDPATGGLRTSTIGDGGSPITSYTVQWREGTSSGCSNTSDVSEAVVASGTMHTIPALDHTSRYCLRVIATNDVGDSAPSAQLWRRPAPPPNKPATGVPTVTGPLRVGEFVTADTSGIADEDGLTNASFGYGWHLDPGARPLHPSEGPLPQAQLPGAPRCRRSDHPDARGIPGRSWPLRVG